MSSPSRYFRVGAFIVVASLLFSLRGTAGVVRVYAQGGGLPTFEAVESLDIRGGPSILAPFVATLPAGTSRIVIGRNANSVWFQINYAGREAWVCGVDTILDGTLQNVPVTNDSHEDCTGRETPPGESYNGLIGRRADPDLPICNLHSAGGDSGRVLVLLQGLGTKAGSSDDQANRWSFLTSDLQDLYSYVVYFSYDGFNEDNPDSYQATDTFEGVFSHHLPLLRDLLASCRRYPGVESFDLMGHSMGGVVALNYARRTLTDYEDQVGWVRHVITLDSPINGSSKIAIFGGVLELTVPLGELESLRDMADMYLDHEAIASANLFDARELHEQGVEIWTLTNRDDQAVPLGDATIPTWNHVYSLGHDSRTLVWAAQLGHNQIYTAPAARNDLHVILHTALSSCGVTIFAEDTAGLIAAITAANADADADTICLEAGVYRLEAVDNQTLDDGPTVLPVITTPMTFSGAGAGVTVIEAGDIRARVFQVASSGSLTLNDLTVSGGSLDFDGGGILIDGGQVSINSAVFSGHNTRSGGAIYNRGGTLVIAGSSFFDNHADFGGAIYNSGGTVAAERCVFSRNTAGLSTRDTYRGGGIYNLAGTVAISRSTFNANVTDNGSAIYSDDGQVSITESCIYGNRNDTVRGSAVVGASVFNETHAPETEASYNWWGAEDGPSGVGLGRGDSVSANVRFGPMLGVNAAACPVLP